jgi:hypothetical protein
MIKKREEVGVRPGTFYRSLPFSKGNPLKSMSGMEKIPLKNCSPSQQKTVAL